MHEDNGKAYTVLWSRKACIVIRMPVWFKVSVPFLGAGACGSLQGYRASLSTTLDSSQQLQDVHTILIQTALDTQTHTNNIDIRSSVELFCKRHC
jgi:hypothetical protein